MSWEVIKVLDSSPHVLPINDLREHLVSKHCWCSPYENNGVIIHNSKDKREYLLEGKRPN